MALAVYFHPASLTTAQYDEAISKLDAAGAGAPQGRLHQSSFGADGSLMVYEVWESQAAFEAYGPTLMPILAEVGIDPGAPDNMPVHNLVNS